MLNRNGYELFSILPGFKDKRNGRMLQVDGFFIRGKPCVYVDLRANSTPSNSQFLITRIYLVPKPIE